MAELVGDAFVEIKAAEGSLKKDVNRLLKSIEKPITLDFELNDRQIDREFEKIVSGLNNTIDINTDIDDSGLKNVIKEFDAAGEKAATGLETNIEEAIENLDLDFDSITEEADKIGKESGKEFSSSFERNADMDGIGKRSIDKFGSIFKTGALALGVAAGTAVAAGLSQAFDTQAAEGRLSALLGLNDAESERLGRIQGELYRNAYGDSIEGLTDTTAVAIRALGSELDQLSDDEISNLIVDIENISKTFDASSEEIGDSIRGIISNDLAPNAEAAADALTRGLQVDPSGDIIDTFREYGTELKQLGISAEEFISIADAGLKAGARNTDFIADAFKEANIRIQEGAEDNVAALKDLGLNAAQIQADIAGGGEGADEAFSKVLKSLSAVDDEVKKNELGVAILGTKYEDLGGDVIDAMAGAADSIEGLDNATEDLDKNINDNIGTSIETIKRQLLGGLGEALAPVASLLADFLSDIDFAAVGKVVGDLFKPLGTAISAFASNIDIDGIFGVLQNVFESLGEFFADNEDTFVGFFESLGEVVGIFVDFVIENQDVFLGIFEAIGAVLVPIIDVISFLLPVLAELTTFLLDIMLTVLTPLINLLGLVDDAWKLWWGTLQAVAGFFTGQWATAVSSFNKLNQDVINAVNSALSAVTSRLAALREQFNSAINFIVNLGPRALKAGKDFGASIISGITDAFKVGGNFAKEIVNQLINFLNANVIQKLNSLVEFEFLGQSINPPDIPNIPALAQGAIVKKEMIAKIGEDGAEVVVPLTRPRRALELSDQSGLSNLILAANESNGTNLVSSNTDSRNISTTNNFTVVTDPGQDSRLIADSLLDGIASLNNLVGA